MQNVTYAEIIMSQKVAFIFSTLIRTISMHDLDSQDLTCILCPSSRHGLGRVLGHRVETTEKGILVAKPKSCPACAGQQRECQLSETQQKTGSLKILLVVAPWCKLASNSTPVDAINTSGGCHCNAEPKAWKERYFILSFLNKGIRQLETANIFLQCADPQFKTLKIVFTFLVQKSPSFIKKYINVSLRSCSIQGLCILSIQEGRSHLLL